MIIWLASYPRSGNTLVRIILRRIFGLGSYSVYGDGGLVDRPDQARAAGHLSFGENFADAYGKFVASPEPCIIKTHEFPSDNERTIYVVRDGRSVARSFACYLRDFHGLPDSPRLARDVILGFTSVSSWSDHLDAWNPLERPGLLLLRYEQILDDPQEQINQLAHFLNMEPRGIWRNNFDELSRLEPRFFRAGPLNQPDNALSDAEAELFWTMHGRWMRRLGYVSPDYHSGGIEATDTFRRALHCAFFDQRMRLIAAESEAHQLRMDLRRRESIEQSPAR